jgi:hypothetical protein
MEEEEILGYIPPQVSIITHLNIYALRGVLRQPGPKALVAEESIATISPERAG